MTRPPPRYTLFPYTTLFRSQPDDRVPHRVAGFGVVPTAEHPPGNPNEVERPEEVPQWVLRDRKSTRLNSSHMSISYAVFCFKKKKTASLHAHLHWCILLCQE